MEELELELIDYGVDEIFAEEGTIMIYGAFESFNDIQKYLEEHGKKCYIQSEISENKITIANAIYNLIVWCSETHTRMGQTSYYVSLNIGLAKNEFARFIAFTLIDEFEKAGDLIFKPNIIFTLTIFI